jgi:hypothetical protein
MQLVQSMPNHTPNVPEPARAKPNLELIQLANHSLQPELKVQTLQKHFTPVVPAKYREHLQLKTRAEARIEPIRSYSESTIQLLANFFSGKPTTDEKKRLASELLFPNYPNTAAKWRESSGTSHTPETQQVFNAHSLFPSSPAAADLWLKNSTTPDSLTLDEHIALYLFRSGKEPLANKTATSEIKKALQTFHKKNLPDTVLIPLLTKEVPRFIRAELISPQSIASSNQELASLFATSVDLIETILCAPETGLTSTEVRLRDEKLVLQQQLLDDPLETNFIATVRQVVAIENNLQKSGIIISLSKPEQLADLFNCTVDTMKHYLHFLHEEDLDYRVQQIPNSTQLRDEKKILALVESAAEQGQYFSYKQLAAQTQAHPLFIYHLLKERLPATQWELQKLHSDLPVDGSTALEQIKHFVEGELECLLSNQGWAISNDEDLSKIFNCSPETIYSALSPSNGRLLDPSSFRAREFALTLRQPLSPATKALHSYLADEIRERLVKNGGTVIAKKTPSKQTSSWRPVHLNGHDFSSFEEAACGLLLQKYIPNFVLEDTKTLQVPINGRSIDFKVGDYFVEYHPIQLYWTANGRGSFASREDYLEFQKIREEVSKGNDGVRAAFSARVESELRTSYYDFRLGIINGSAYAGCPLFVVDSAESLYHFISQTGHQLPSIATFDREFRHLVATARARNKS